ncbi:MAG: hypothetical protein AAGA11_00265 [Pseudomonadota bacterium]
MNLPRTVLLLTAAMALTGPVWGDGETACRKQVFGDYCLGGDTSALRLDPVPEVDNTFTDSAGPGHTRLEVVDDTLVAVERRVEPGGWREFDRWLKRLERVYRSGEDNSTFPRYAASRSSKLNAIRSGRGSARVDWPQGGWTLSLIWREPDAIHLRYAVSDADQDRLSLDEL